MTREWAHDGPIPDPDRCNECDSPTVGGSVLCHNCAWNRYYDQLDEFWDENPLTEEAS